MRKSVVFLLMAACALARAADPPGSGIALELNRLESRESGCRMHVVLANGTGTAHATLQLDLVLFATDGVIARRIALDASPVRARKTSVFAFDVQDLSCDQFGRVLLNDVTGCGSADCVSSMSVSSRAGVALEK